MAVPAPALVDRRTAPSPDFAASLDQLRTAHPLTGMTRLIVPRHMAGYRRLSPIQRYPETCLPLGSRRVASHP